MLVNAAVVCSNQHEQGTSNLGVFIAQIDNNFFEAQNRMILVALWKALMVLWATESAEAARGSASGLSVE